MNSAEMSDDDAVRQLLDESGLAPSAPLESSLLALRAAGEAPIPAPSPEVLAYLTPAAGAATAGAQVVPLRRRRTVRGALVLTAAVATTGLGVSGVAAANPDFRAAADQAVRHVVGFLAPSGTGQEAPRDHSVPEAPAHIPAVTGEIPIEEDGSGSPDTGTGTDSPAGPAAPARPAAPGPQPGPQAERAAGTEDAAGQDAKRPPGKPSRDALPAVPPLEGGLPDPSLGQRGGNPGKGAPREKQDVPVPASGHLPTLPAIPAPER
jgi:hypothetical protein